MPDGQRGGDQSGRTGKKTARGSRGGQGVAKRAQAGAGKAKTPMMQSQQAQQKRASSMGGGGGGAKKGGAGAGGGGQVDVGDAISSVYDWHQKQGLKMPTYTFEALGSQGPFECTLTLLDGSEWRGRGKKKSEAKASASREALRGGLDKALARRAANLTRGISGGGVGGVQNRLQFGGSADQRSHSKAGGRLAPGQGPVQSAWETGRLAKANQMGGLAAAKDFGGIGGGGDAHPVPWGAAPRLEGGTLPPPPTYKDSSQGDSGSARLQAFLAEVGLSTHQSMLAENEMDLSALMLCTVGDLEQIGMPSGDAERIVQRLRQTPSGGSGDGGRGAASLLGSTLGVGLLPGAQRGSGDNHSVPRLVGGGTMGVGGLGQVPGLMGPGTAPGGGGTGGSFSVWGGAQAAEPPPQYGIQALNLGSAHDQPPPSSGGPPTPTIKSWLQGLGAAAFESAFNNEGFDALDEVLAAQLSEQDLAQEIGIDDASVRARVLNAISAANSERSRLHSANQDNLRAALPFSGVGSSSSDPMSGAAEAALERNQFRQQLKMPDISTAPGTGASGPNDRFGSTAAHISSASAAAASSASSSSSSSTSSSPSSAATMSAGVSNRPSWSPLSGVLDSGVRGLRTTHAASVQSSSYGILSSMGKPASQQLPMPRQNGSEQSSETEQQWARLSRAALKTAPSPAASPAPVSTPPKQSARKETMSVNEAMQRNQRMITAMKAAVGGDPARFETVKQLSLLFRRGELGSREYMQQMAFQFGGVRNMRGFFPDMVALMPDEEKSNELTHYYTQLLESDSSAQSAGHLSSGSTAASQDPLEQLRAFMSQSQHQPQPQPQPRLSSHPRQQQLPPPPSQRQPGLHMSSQRAPFAQTDRATIYDVLIIGGGAAGIAAALALQQAGLSVMIIEGRDRLGGRAHSIMCAGLQSVVDVGASHLYGSKEHKHLLSKAQLEHIPFRVANSLEETSIYDEEELCLTGSTQHEPVLNYTKAQDSELHSALVQFTRQGRQGPDVSVTDALQETYQKCCCGWGPGMGGLRSRVLDWRLHAWHVADHRTRAKLDDLSAHCWGQGMDDTSNGDVEFSGGYGSCIRRFAEQLKTVRLERVVQHIKYEDKPLASQVLRSAPTSGDADPVVTVSCRCPNGAQEQYVGRFAIVTLPIGVLGAGQVTFSPPLPQRKLQAIGRLGAAKMNKVVLHFRSQFWGQNRHIGIASTSGQHGWFYNASSVCKAPVLVYYLMGDAAQAAEQMPDASIVAQCLRMLRAAFRPTHVPEPVGTYVTRWCSDPLARGAFSFFEVGSSPADCAALKEPLGWRRLNVGFAGEAATVTNMGTVLGAWLSGEAEAKRVLKEMTLPLRAGEAQPTMARSSSGGWASAVANTDHSSSERPSDAGHSSGMAGRSISEADERERQERLAFIGKGAGVKPEGCTSIFVGNLPYNVSSAAVTELFSVVGRSKIVRVSVKQGKGFAHVEFSHTNCVDKAFPVVQGMKFQGRRIRLDYANKAKGTGGGSGGGVSRHSTPLGRTGRASAPSVAREQAGSTGSNKSSATHAGGSTGGGSKDASSAAGGGGADCPLCCETLDQTDQAFTPCSCGYQICLWCFHRLKDHGDGRCPACRTVYADGPDGGK